MAQNAAATDQYMSVINSDSLVVPVRASTVYTAQEKSLFLGGALVPVIQAPNGVAQVPFLTSVSASTVSSEADPGVDIAVTTPGGTKNTITCDLIAARTVLRDLGNVDPNEIGRVLGNAVAVAFDTAVYTALDGIAGGQQYDYNNTGSTTLAVDDIYEAVEVIRGAGEMGQLFAVLSPAVATDLMKDIGTDSYAGGDFQTEALRNGYIGKMAGVNMFMSSNISGLTNSSDGFIFGADAARIAMQANVNVEIGRRTEAVGNDIVAHLHAGVGVVDETRAVRLRSVA